MGFGFPGLFARFLSPENSFLANIANRLEFDSLDTQEIAEMAAALVSHTHVADTYGFHGRCSQMIDGLGLQLGLSGFHATGGSHAAQCRP